VWDVSPMEEGDEFHRNVDSRFLTNSSTHLLPFITRMMTHS
jgi:hypothetical protein